MKVISKIALAVIMVLLLLATFAALTATSAHAAEFKWEHFGADPYAATREEAMKAREDAFHKLGFSDPIVVALMEATESPGEKVRIVNGDRFDAMLSKGSVVHKDVLVAVKDQPKGNGIEFAAVAEKWEVTMKGTTYTLLLPEVCNNWTGIVPKLQKVVVSFRSIPGSCPNGYLLVANAWSLSTMPQGLRDTAMKLVNEAEDRESENASKRDAYKPSAFSRKLGGPLRHEVKTRADVSTRITVNLRDPLSFKVVQTLGAMEMVNGIGKMSLTKDQVTMVVETIWPNGFVSPAISGGERRVELFFPEWGPWCEMNVHGAKP
jgi:hypothetical protein